MAREADAVAEGGDRLGDRVAGRPDVDRFADRVESWLTGPDGDPPPEGLGAGVSWLRLDAALYRELDVSGTGGPLLLARVPEMAAWSDADPWPDGCTLFIPFQDPENVGAVLRSAAAFGVARAVLLREAAHPFHPKAIRAAGPAVFQVPLLSGPSIDALTGDLVPIIPLDVDGPDLARWLAVAPDPLRTRRWLGVAWLVGAAVHGAMWSLGFPWPYRFSATVLVAGAVIWWLTRPTGPTNWIHELSLRLSPETGGRGLWGGALRRQLMRRTVARPLPLGMISISIGCGLFEASSTFVVTIVLSPSVRCLIGKTPRSSDST